MHRPPRSPRSGISRPALLLVCAGAGLLLVLGFVLVRSGDPRSGEAGRGVHAAPPLEAEQPAVADDAAGIELIPAVTLEEDGAAAPQVPVVALVGGAPQPSAQTAAPGSDAAKATAEGPTLNYVRGEGTPETYKKGELRSDFRQQRREQRERDAEQAAATGETRATPAKKAAPGDERRSRIQRKKQRSPDGG